MKFQNCSLSNMTAKPRLVISTMLIIVFIFINGCSGVSDPYESFEKVTENETVVVLLPDTQGYSENYPEIFEAQTQWISDNKSDINFMPIIHLGDLVEVASSDNQWSVAKKSFDILSNAEVPFIIAPGNHDYGIYDDNNTAKDRSTLLHEYFPPEIFTSMDTFQSFYPEEGRVDNSYHIYESRGVSWLIFAIEFGPRDEVLEWVNEIIESHDEDFVILATHAYLYNDNLRHDNTNANQEWNPHRYGIASIGSVNDGQQIWDKVISQHPNILLVVSGHVLGDGLGNAISVGVGVTQEMLVNYQMNENAGDGFMRILIIDTDTRHVKVRSYSPWKGEYKHDEDNEFEFSY